MSEYLRKGEIFPVKGQNLSVPSTILPEGHAFPENMHYIQGEVRKRDGSAQLGDVTLGAQKVLHLATFQLSSGLIRLMRHTRYNTQRYNTSTKKFNNFSGNDLTGDETNFFSHAVVTESDLYLFARLSDNIRKFDDSNNTSDLGGAAGLFKAKFLEYLSPYVFAAYTVEGGNPIPTKGRWSDSNNPEVWNSGNAGSKLFTDDATDIRGVKKLKDLLFVYKEGMSYRGRTVSTAAVLDFTPFEQGRGLYAPRTLTEADGMHFYMGLNDFHVNNGTRIENIGGKIREFIFKRLNRSKNETCHAIHVEEFKEVWFYITVSGADWPTEIWKYNYEFGFWMKDTCSNIITAANYKVIDTVAWDDAVGTWDEQRTSWDEQGGGADAPIQVFGNDLGITTRRDTTKRQDNGVNYAGRQETVDYTGLAGSGAEGAIGIEQDQEWLRLDLWAKGDSVDIYYSVDFGQTWNFLKAQTLTSAIKQHTVYLHVVAPHIRFRFQNNRDEDFYVRHFIPYYLDGGEIENP